MQEPTPVEKSATPELTFRVIMLGLILSVVMGAANVYVGLKAGMTVSASIPAAVMAMLIFKLLFRVQLALPAQLRSLPLVNLLFRRSSILEANQVQTCASAGESLAAGIIFTMPAMILIGFWKDFDFWTVTMIALTGGLLGILFMIPMRRVFVVDNKDLAYPEGVACAAVLNAGESKEGSSESLGLVAGGLLGAAVKFLGSYLGLFAATLENATAINSRVFYFGGDLSPMLVAVGFIVRLNVALLIFIGGALAWLIGIPLLGTATDLSDPVDAAYGMWSSQIRYVGVGAMVVGGFSSLISVRHGLLAAVSQLWQGVFGGAANSDDKQRDIPSVLIVFLGLVCTGLLAYVNYTFTDNVGITILSTCIMLLMGFFFTGVASYIVGLVGNSNSPVSGMTITAVLVAGGLLWLFDYSGMDAMVATLGIAAVVCCVACTSGDVCNDLKTGSLVGAAPFRQQIMQIAGVCIAAFVMAPILKLLHENTPGGIGGENLAAPQASLFANLAKGFSGEMQLPWILIAWGAALGVVILIIDTFLKQSGSGFRAYLMPIAVGMYLPFGLATPILIGGLIAHFYSRRNAPEEHDRVLHQGVLFSSGVIAGEALTAVGIAGLAARGFMPYTDLLDPSWLTPMSVAVAVVAVLSFIVMCRPSKD